MSVAAHAENHVEQYWHHVKHMRPDIVCPAGLFCLAQLSQPSQLQLKIRQRLPCPCDCQLTGSTGCVSMSIPAQILHQIGPLNEVVLSLSDKNKVGRTVLYIPNLVPPYMDPW